MENFENENVSSQREYTEPQVPQAPQAAQTPRDREQIPQENAYRGTGAGRRESPYADSPYVMRQPQPEQGGYRYQPQQPRTEYRYQPQQEVPQKPRHKKQGGFWKKALAALAAAALVIGSCAVTAGIVNDRWEKETAQMEASFRQQMQSLQAQIEAQAPSATGNSISGTAASVEGYGASQVYAQNVQSVVLIECTVTGSYYGQTTTGTSAGSGFILTEDGYVITNYHVIEGATSVKVRFYDNSVKAAQVIGYDDTNDVAVLKVEATGLNPVTLGSSDDLIVGDQVAAIGNPLGELTSTLTVGYVSAKERDVTTDGTIINMLQTDCAINSGNSGGPLFNMKGEVVGITTAKYSGSSASGASIEGIGFAIPIDDVTDAIAQLVENGYIDSGYMGIIVQNMDANTASVYGLPIGAYVVQVEPDGGAYAAGIQEKDIITRVDDETIENITDLTKALRKYKAGDVAKVTVYRGGREMTLNVTLAQRPADTGAIVDEWQNSQNPQGSQEPQNPQGSMPEGSYEDWFNFFAPFFGYGDNNG